MTRDRVLGCLYAGALADGLCFAHEGKAPGPVEALRWGRLSDDTQLTLATCEGVTDADGQAKPEVIAESFVRWHRTRGFCGLGAATTKALRELSVGGHWALVGRRGEMAAGNGAAIRVAPLAFTLDLAMPRARQRVRDIARITHHNDEAYVGALAIALAIQWAPRWEGRKALFGRLVDQLPDTSLRDRLHSLQHMDASIGEVAACSGTSGYVVESVPLALHAYSHAAEGMGLRQMLIDLVEAGGDCDSTGAMAAQCLGATLGVGVLSPTDVERLPAHVIDIAVRFADALS